MKRSEEGAALLTVLLLVAILAVMAAAAMDRTRLAVRLSGNAAAASQARSYGYAAELLAVRRIGDLLQADPSRTTLAGDWNGREVAFPVDAGSATATLRDGGNCFNLNSLVTGSAEAGFASRPEAAAQLARLMVALEVPPPDAQRAASAAADWIDSDGAPQPGGAEDETYQALEPRYRAANTLMADPSELRAVAGVSPQLYARLRPFLCALPVTDLSGLNINTLAVAQAPLLAMLLPVPDVERAARAIAARPTAGWPDLGTFLAQPALAQAGDLTQLKTATTWFDLRLRIRLADAELEQNALIDARQKPGKLVRRSYGEPT